MRKYCKYEGCTNVTNGAYGLCRKHTDMQAWMNHTLDPQTGCWVTPAPLRDADFRDAWIEWNCKPVPYAHYVRNDKYICRHAGRCVSPNHLVVMTEFERLVFA